MKLSRKSIKAIRRKLDIFRKWLDQGKMDLEDIVSAYQSWRAHAMRCNSYGTLQGMDERFCKLFAEELARRKRRFKCTMGAKKTAAGWVYYRREEKEEKAA